LTDRVEVTAWLPGWASTVNSARLVVRRAEAPHRADCQGYVHGQWPGGSFRNDDDNQPGRRDQNENKRDQLLHESVRFRVMSRIRVLALGSVQATVGEKLAAIASLTDRVITPSS